MTIRSVLGILVVIATCACNSELPGPPTAPTPIVPAPPEPARHVSGLVLDTRDAPVPGAELKFNAFGGPVTALSDDLGRFEVTLDAWSGGLYVSVEKGGYERSVAWISTAKAAAISQNIRLHQPVYVAGGGAIRLAINADDPSCGFDLEYHCRRVRLTTSTAGTITARVVADRADTRLGLALS